MSLTLSPDQLVISFSVPIIDDNSVEGAETFRGVLSTSLESVMLINSTISVTILDDDEVCIKFNQVVYRVSEEEGIATLSVSKEGLNNIPIHIAISTEDGTAISKSHYNYMWSLPQIMKFLLLKYFRMARTMQMLIAQNLSTLINTV